LLFAVAVGLHFKAEAFALDGQVAIARKGGCVYEDVVPAVVGQNKAEPALGIPFF
jgi:hypothetical protein